MSHRGGYTIVEVLIFIGVSAAIFFSAMTAIGGRQEQVQFAQSVREFDAKVRDILNDVTTGYFPTNETVQCEVVNGKPEITIDSDTNLGTNSECIFVGKAIQFMPDGKGEQIAIYTLAGRRYEDEDLTPTTSIAEAHPVAIARSGDNPSFKDATEQYDLLYGLRVTKVFRPSDDATEYGLVGIFTQFGGAGVSDAQSVQVGGIIGSSAGQDKDAALGLLNIVTDDITSVGDNGYIEKNTKEGIVVCLASYNGDRKSSVAFGARGSTATTLDIDTYNPECDA
jgi:hypothetical protein